jgi:predicted ATP-dependent protease
VIWEENPTYERLFGAADGNQRSMIIPGVGMVKTEGPGGPTFKTGSYVKANGGFLVLRAVDVLKNPGVWEALMSAVRTGQAEIADGGFLGMASQQGDIHHLPSKVKIVLIGSPMIQMMLAQHDEDFTSNFSGVANFQSAIRITDEAVEGFLNFLHHAVAGSAGQIMALTRDAIGRVLEHAARLADSNRQFTAEFGALHGLLQEATYAAQKAGRSEVRGEDVDSALQAKIDREDVYFKQMSEQVWAKRVRLDTTGSAVGQISGLAVVGSETSRHGVQMRITFVAGPADSGHPAGIFSVDQAAGRTGPSFIKALGIEYSFVMNEFGYKKPLNAHIRVSYEQNSGGIDGDSSTSTTMYGILSALSGVPIDQRFAVTGSADQFGNVDPIGGVNEKIEGFFELCDHRGLTGDQGIIIPRTNVVNLQLSPKVAQAIKDGKFHIYAVDTVAQGMEILTGVAYKTIKKKAAARLDEIANAK